MSDTPPDPLAAWISELRGMEEDSWVECRVCGDDGRPHEMADNLARLDARPSGDRLFQAVRQVIREGIDTPGVRDELHAAFYEARDTRPSGDDARLLARWPEADLFAALDAEGWFRGMDAGDATRLTSKVYARLARPSGDEALRAALEAELANQRAKPNLMRSSGYESGIEFALRALATPVSPPPDVEARRVEECDHPCRHCRLWERAMARESGSSPSPDIYAATVAVVKAWEATDYADLGDFAHDILDRRGSGS